MQGNLSNTVLAQAHQILHKTDPALQDLSTKSTEENILSQPIAAVHRWVLTGHGQITTYLRAAHRHAKLNTQDSRKFFKKIPHDPCHQNL